VVTPTPAWRSPGQAILDLVQGGADRLGDREPSERRGTRETDAGDANAVRRLRRLHWNGMLCNAILLFAVVASIPYVSATTT